MAKKKRGARSIIQGYLEKVGSGVFERYQDAITRLITGKQGVYALYRRHKLHYVGLASDLRGRIRHHLRDRHRGKWDRFSLYVIRKEDHTREVEALLVRIAEPRGNTQRGQLKRSNNLLPKLKQQVKREQEEERENLFEQHEKRMTKGRTDRTQAKSGTGRKEDKPLKGLLRDWQRIYASYKGRDYKAKVLSSGSIKFNGKLYSSPSGAANAIIERGAVNGWCFWKYKNDKGEMVALADLRK